MTKITVSVEVKSTLNKVWESWNEPKHIVNWCSGDDSWHTPNATNDLKVGGRFLSRMEAKDGSMGFDFGGKYTEIIERNFIKYVMDDGRDVENIFEEIGDIVKVTTVFDAENINSIELQRQGWQHISNNFKNYTEKL